MKLLSVGLIGRNRETRGVVPRVIPVKENSDLNPRWDIASEQSLLLGQGCVPTGPLDRVVKLATLVNDGNVRMWFGCYFAADFPDNSRGGTYVGAGVLVDGTFISIEAATRYVLQILARMQGLVRPGGLIFESVYDFDLQALGANDADIFRNTRDDARVALSPGYQKQLFVDASGDSVDWTNSPQLVDLLKRVVKLPSLSSCSAVLVSNSREVAINAEDSRRFSMLDASRPGPAAPSDFGVDQPAEPDREWESPYFAAVARSEPTVARDPVNSPASTINRPQKTSAAPPQDRPRPEAPAQPCADLRKVEALLGSIQAELKSIHAQVAKKSERRPEAVLPEDVASEADWLALLKTPLFVLVAFLIGLLAGVYWKRF